MDVNKEYKDVHKEYVVCVPVGYDHVSDCYLEKCVQCEQSVWVSPHHMGKREPICMSCFEKLVKENKDVEIRVLPEDIERAIEARKKRKVEDKDDN